MTPLFLTTPELLDKWWDKTAVHFEPVVSEAARGEFTVSDIKRLCEENRALIGIAIDGENVVIAMAFEFVFYPRITACNIIALGGSCLNEVVEQFFITFKEFCYGIGVTVIEASCSSAMSRLLRRYGFAKTYEVVRLAI